MKKMRAVLLTVLSVCLLLSTTSTFAERIDAVFNTVRIVSDGKVITEKNKDYELYNGSKVPFSIVYSGTTYLPVRKISETLGYEIKWDDSTRTVSVNSPKKEEPVKNENRYDFFDTVYDFGKLNGIDTAAETFTVRSIAYHYRAKDVTDNMIESYKKKLSDDGFTEEKNKCANVAPVYTKDDIKVTLDLGIYTDFVYCITVSDMRKPACNHKNFAGNGVLPTYSSVFTGEYSSAAGYYTYAGSWDTWGCTVDYISLLEECGFTLTNVQDGKFGNIFSYMKSGKSASFGLLSHGTDLAMFDVMYN